MSTGDNSASHELKPYSLKPSAGKLAGKTARGHGSIEKKNPDIDASDAQ
jgi:hypothetical protein